MALDDVDDTMWWYSMESATCDKDMAWVLAVV